MPSSFSVIIPVHNPPPELVEGVARLVGICGLAESAVLLVDDGSTNGVPQRVCERHPGVRRVQGDGSLWWGGAIALGQKAAFESGSDAVVWLNHDCMPDAGTVERLVGHCVKDGVGAVSAWCYCRSSPEFGVNPGFRKFREIPTDELNAEGLVEVDGTNGNCVAVSMAAIRAVGPPRADWHPHYGDGPYLFRIHRAGFRNYVDPKSRATLEREFDRCISERDHSRLWSVPLRTKLRYYWFSHRSKFHWKHRFFDCVVFRGWVKALPYYLAVQARLLLDLVRGSSDRAATVEEDLSELVEKYADRFPRVELERDLIALSRRK